MGPRKISLRPFGITRKPVNPTIPSLVTALEVFMKAEKALNNQNLKLKNIMLKPVNWVTKMLVLPTPRKINPKENRSSVSLC